MTKSNLEITRKPNFEWYIRYMVRCGHTNMDMNKIHVKKSTGLRAQNMLIILDSIVNIIGGRRGEDYMTI